MNLSSLFFSLKRFIIKFLFETPRKENLNPIEAAICAVFVRFAPLLLAAFVIVYIQYIFWILLLGWIPYLTWLALIHYFKWKDNKASNE